MISQVETALSSFLFDTFIDSAEGYNYSKLTLTRIAHYFIYAWSPLMYLCQFSFIESMQRGRPLDTLIDVFVTHSLLLFSSNSPLQDLG